MKSPNKQVRVQGEDATAAEPVVTPVEPVVTTGTRAKSRPRTSSRRKTVVPPEIAPVPAPVVAEPVVEPLVEPLVEAPPVVADVEAVVAAPVVLPLVAPFVVKGKKKAAKKPRLIRDSFTIPENEYLLIAALKQQAMNEGCEVKKSELLRAGLAVLASMSTAQLLETISKVDRLKTGRPAK
jgi:hypothetical protein